MGALAPLGVVHLSAWRDVVLVLAGAGAGIFNGVAGGGTLITFPVLLALGFGPLTANITNTVGIWPGYVGGTAGFRVEIGDQRAHLRTLLPLAGVGAVVGAVLLLTTPSEDFSALAPWLVLLAALLFAAQPLLTRFLAGRAHHLHRLLLYGGTLLAAVYGGYFGAGLGVMLLALLGLALPDTLARTGGLRTILSVAVNGIAAAIFIVHVRLDWDVVGLLAAGSLAGGWVGARVALRLPVTVLRLVVVAIGLATTVALLVK
jgi:uncharacterized membrane protein YfcA